MNRWFQSGKPTGGGVNATQGAMHFAAPSEPAGFELLLEAGGQLIQRAKGAMHLDFECKPDANAFRLIGPPFRARRLPAVLRS